MNRMLFGGIAAAVAGSLTLAGCASTSSSSTTSSAAAPASSAAAPAASEAAPATSAAAASAAAPGVVPATIDQMTAFDITKLCGDKPTTVALLDGYGTDTWRKTTLAELKDEASKCPNITEVLYTDAGGDQQKMESAIKSYADQGVNIIMAFPDFGPALLPAMKYATEAGATMVDWFIDLHGNVGTDYTLSVYQDSDKVARGWADWYGADLKTGNVVVLGGPAGAGSSQTFMDSFADQIKQYPGITLLDSNYIVTNWSPVDAQKAAAGLMAKYPQIDGIASDYGVTASAAAKAFQQAGKPVPAIATIAGSNEFNCLWTDAQAKDQEWPMLSNEASTKDVRAAIRHAMAAYQGLDNSAEPLGVLPPVGIDTYQGWNPICNPNIPPDAALYPGLTDEQLQQVFAN